MSAEPITVIVAQTYRHADFWRLQQRIEPGDAIIVTSAEHLERLHGIDPPDIGRAVVVSEPARPIVRTAIRARLRALGVNLEAAR